MRKCKYHLCDNEANRRKATFCSEKCKNKYHVDKRRLKMKILAIKYKGGECQNCGYNKCIAALEFHHRNPEEKSFGIGTPLSKTWEAIRTELDKCDLLCSNCHREVEFQTSLENKPFIQELIDEIL